MAQVSTRAAALDGSKERRKRPRGVLLAGIVLAAGVLLALIVFAVRGAPMSVEVISPQAETIRETIAGTGTVYGVHETLVGAQLNGVVQQLYVEEGDRVRAGQVLAIVNDRVVQAQVAQARANLDTARAQLLQTLERAPESDIRAASQQVSQAAAQADQQRAIVQQTQRGEHQANAQLGELRTQAALAAKTYDRAAALYRQGYTPRADYDAAQAQLRVAEQRVAAQQGAVESAQAGERAAAATLRGAEANTQTLRARLDTLLTGAQPEEIAVARSRVTEAQRALQAAQRQAENAVVRAPFAGTISAIGTESGQTVGASGIVQLVSKSLEVRLDVDELNLGELAPGQTASISSNAFRGTRIAGTVSRVGASVDKQRGTVTATITPRAIPPWLRSGQSVNVEIVTANAVRRLLLPASAITRDGDRTVVYVVQDGRAVDRDVIVRPATPRGVPVISGLTERDRVVRNAGAVSAGVRVRVR